MNQDLITEKLSEVSTVFRNDLDKAVQPLGVHGGQVSILLELHKKDGQSQTELASRLRVSAPTVSNMVKSLIRRRFVEAIRSEHDARVTLIWLTEESRRLKVKLELAIERFEDEYFSVFTETERLIFAQLLTKLTRSIRKTDENDKC